MANKPRYILIDTKNLSPPVNKYNFIYYLNETIDIKKYIELQLFITARMNFFINKNNNSFKIIFHKDNTNYIINFNLSLQNYSPLSLCEQINLLFSTYNGIIFNTTYDQFSYKIKFTCNYPFSLDLTFSLFHKVISLEKIIYQSDNNTLSGFINFNSPYYLKFNINNITSNNVINNNNNNSQQVSWIIPLINKNFGEIVEYRTSDYNMRIETTFKSNYLDISIYDDTDYIYDNNSYNWFGILKYE